MPSTNDKVTPNYALNADLSLPPIAPPPLPYRVREPQDRSRRIALVGCGGISETHLQAYRAAGYDVPLLCSLRLANAERRRDQFYPQAAVTDRFEDVLAREDIQIVDLTPYPRDRLPLIEAALRAGKHVLSQKPFVVDLESGRRLAAMADEKGVKLAVNQNGRWAPHFAYLRETVRAGLIGTVAAVRQSVHWDHSWIRSLPFNDIPQLILYDFAIHWFDFVVSVMGERAVRQLRASVARSPAQKAKPPMLAQVMIDYDDAQVSLTFDADTPLGAEDRTFIAGTEGAARSVGPDLSHQTVTVYTRNGWFQPQLEGSWFPGGFHGAMAELMCAIEENRLPLHNAWENLRVLDLCMRAVHEAFAASGVR